MFNDKDTIFCHSFFILYFYLIKNPINGTICSTKVFPSNSIFMKKRLFFFCICLALIGTVQGQIETASPDGRYVFKACNTDSGLSFSVEYEGETVIQPSPMGYQESKDDTVRLQFSDSKRPKIISNRWHPVYGERAVVEDKYRERIIPLSGGSRPQELVIRAYDEGVAFCFRYPGEGVCRFSACRTAYTLPKGSHAYFASAAQAPYRYLPLDTFRGETERPLVARLPSGVYLCLTEARMVDFSRARYRVTEDTPGLLQCSLAGPVTLESPCETPWQVVMAARHPAEFLNHNDLILNLNPPCAIDDPSWITPGKVMREVTLSTEGAKALVDFAAQHHLQYLHFDAGWYGYEYDKEADATTVTVDPRRNPKGDLDLAEAIRYAKEHGIKVILYVNQIALHQQLDELLPLYREWGVSGIKFGFVHVGSQANTEWLHEAVRKCADYGLVVNIHDEYRPTGFSRTYPNLLTQEGIRGNEEFEDATHNVTQAFIRFIAGAADNTVCYYRRDFNENEAMRDHEGRSMKQKLLRTTPAHQLALPVVYYSPLQYLYWYDKPSDSQGEPELSFYDHLPTVWDDTKVLDGAIGRFIITARRSGQEWFLGALSGNAPETVTIPFTFLPRGKSYQAIRYTDGGPETGTRTRVAIDTLTVNSRTVLEQPLRGSGGAAFRLIPTGGKKE